MGFNYGLEKRKFTEEWKKLYSEYKAAGCCFSERMRKVFRKNEKSMLQNCNKKAKKKRALTTG